MISRRYFRNLAIGALGILLVCGLLEGARRGSEILTHSHCRVIQIDSNLNVNPPRLVAVAAATCLDRSVSLQYDSRNLRPLIVIPGYEATPEGPIPVDPGRTEGGSLEIREA